MRKLGYFFLFAGFFWIVGQQIGISLKTAMRPVVLKQYAELSESEVYSAEQVRRHIAATAAEIFEVMPLVVTPGMLMLAGGIFLGRSGRVRSTSLEKQPKQELQ
ncbi:hypothetical protein [Nevskia sp.]|uniref:hypothetical protein n=1 Tax=Nevskia sp. TaxID=1929292 RepID=UPI0025D353C1|nr:hypothetical protein [Nevskia sp.]